MPALHSDSESSPTLRQVTQSNLPASDTLVSDEARLIFQWVLYTVVLMLVSCFGTVTNVINIACFVRQGLKDPVNVSFLGLALSDFGCAVTSLGTSICLIPAFQSSNLPLDSTEFAYVIFAWPHVAFVRITSCLTALVTLERCICITLPLKVKRLVTSKRVAVTVICIFVTCICCVAPVYYANGLGMKMSYVRNRTVLGLVSTDDHTVVDQTAYAINNVFISFSAYCIIIISTIILVLNLRSKASWRRKCTAHNVNTEASFKRDQAVARMVVIISTLFIVCFIPLCVTSVAVMAVPELSVVGRYANTLYVIGGVSLFLETTNSTMNIFVYYNMSTKYRTVFLQMFVRSKLIVHEEKLKCDGN